MKKRVILIGLLVMLFMLATIASALAATYNTKAVHLRKGAGTNYGSYGLVSKGATCNVLETKTVSGELWYKVKITSDTKNSPNLKGKTGWSMAKFIDGGPGGGSSTGGTGGTGTGSTSKPADKGSKVNGYVNANSVNLRELPGTNKKSVAQYNQNKTVLYYNGKHSASNMDWYHVIKPKDGYMASKHITNGTPKYGVPYCTKCNAQLVRGDTWSNLTVDNSPNKVVRIDMNHTKSPAEVKYDYHCPNNCSGSTAKVSVTGWYHYIVDANNHYFSTN